MATFLGSPGMNLIPAERRGNELVTPSGSLAADQALADIPQGPVTLGARPESLSLATDGLRATVALVEMLGAETQVHCTLEGGTTLVVRQGHDEVRPDLGDTVAVAVDPVSLHAFDAETGARIEAVA